MIKFLFALLVIVGLMPTIAKADDCVVKWNNLSPEAIGAFQLWAESWEAYEPRRERYNALALARAILAYHVQPNCAAQLEALGIDESQYPAHLIAQNFASAAGGIPEYIPQLTLANRLAGAGLNLGLPQTARAAPATPPAAAEPRRTTPTPRATTTCGWCSADSI